MRAMDILVSKSPKLAEIIQTAIQEETAQLQQENTSLNSQIEGLQQAIAELTMMSTSQIPPIV